MKPRSELREKLTALLDSLDKEARRSGDDLALYVGVRELLEKRVPPKKRTRRKRA